MSDTPHIMADHGIIPAETLDPIEATSATAGQFGRPADGGLIDREAVEQLFARWIEIFGEKEIRHTSAREYARDTMDDLLDNIRILPAAQPTQDEDKIGALIRVREIALQAETAPLSMMEIVKRVDMALHEETEIPGWMLEPAAQDVAHPDDLPDDLCVLSYVSATPAAQQLLPGAQVGSEPGIPAAQPAQRVKALVDEISAILDQAHADRDEGFADAEYTGERIDLQDSETMVPTYLLERILSALEPAAPDGTEVAMAECQAFSAGYEAGEKATAGGEDLAKLRTEVERLRKALRAEQKGDA